MKRTKDIIRRLLTMGLTVVLMAGSVPANVYAESIADTEITAVISENEEENGTSLTDMIETEISDETTDGCDEIYADPEDDIIAEGTVSDSEDSFPEEDGLSLDDAELPGSRALEGGLLKGTGDIFTQCIPTAEDDEAHLDGKDVRFNNMKWYIIEDNSTGIGEGTVTLLAKDAIAESIFSYSTDNYGSSTVKSYLDDLTTGSGSFAGVAGVIADTDLSDVGVTGAKLYLLSKSEAEQLPSNILKCGKLSDTGSQNWWLRSKFETGGNSVNGIDGGIISTTIGKDIKQLVRPVLRLDLSKVGFSFNNMTFSTEDTSIYCYFELICGANTTSSGATKQVVLYGSEITPVIVTADQGYYFEPFEDFTYRGITVTRTNETTVTLSGKPLSYVSINVPDAVLNLNTYTKLIPKADDNTDTLATKQVTFGGIKWYIIEDNSSNASGGSLTLFPVECIGNATVYNSDYDKGNKYSTSDIKKVVDAMTEEGGILAGVACAINTVNLNTKGYDSDEVYDTVSNVKCYLLDLETAERLPVNIIKCGVAPDSSGYQGTCGSWYLRSPGRQSSMIKEADGDDVNIIFDGILDFKVGVRPALQLDLSAVNFNPGSKEFALKPTYNVTLTGGANTTASGGAKTQKVICGREMSPVTYTADEDCYFEEFDDISVNGITVTRNNKTTVTVSGTPSDNTSIAVPDAKVKQPAVVTLAPEAKNLTFTGKAQELVSAGEASYGIIHYALVKRGAEAPGVSAYSALIPATADAGDYDVYYRVVAEDCFIDSAPGKVSVSIARAPYPLLADKDAGVLKEVEREVRSGHAAACVACVLPVLPDGAKYSNLSMRDNDFIHHLSDPATDFENGILYLSVASKPADTIATITATVKFEKNYEDCKVLLNVKAVDFKDSIWIESIPAHRYTGSAIKPVPVVHFGDRILTSNDYTVSYKNNTKAADKDEVALNTAPAVIVKGKGNYAGTATETFTISALDIGMADAPDIILAFNKKDQKGKTAVTYMLNGKKLTLKEGTDYTLTYEKEKNRNSGIYEACTPHDPGIYRVTVTGKGNYTGTNVFTETIVEPEFMISKATVPAIPAQTYSGKMFVLEDSQLGSSNLFTRAEIKKGTSYEAFSFVIKANGTPLVYGKDYELTYTDNKEIGTATVTITGKGDYIGTRTATFKITGTDIAKVKNDGQFTGTFIYTGAPITQEGYDGHFYYMKGSGRDAERVGLVKDKDYTVTYTDNTAMGTATVVYKGIGGFYGTVKKTFKITGIPMSAVKSDGAFKSSIEYIDGNPVTQEAYDDHMYYMFGSGKGAQRIELRKGIDYTVEYTNNVGIGTATVVYTGIGRCTGTVKKTFKITGMNLASMKNDGKFLSSVEYTGAPITQEYDDHFYYETGKKPNIVRHDLEKGTDYTVTYSDDHTNIGTVTVIYTGKGKYYGTVKKTFKITGTNLTTMKNDGKFLSSVEYTGAPITQEYDDHFYYETGKKPNVDRHDLVRDTDYTVTYSDDHTNIGTVTVIYAGKGKYYGTIKKTFKITGTSMSAVTYPANFDGTTGNNGSAFNSYKNSWVKTNTFMYTGKAFNVAGPAGAVSETDNYGIALTLKDKKTGAVLETLKNGKDYTVTYKNNTEPGTASVTFTGKGKYTGSVTKTFTIQPNNTADENEINGYIAIGWPDKSRLWCNEADSTPVYTYVKGGVKPEPVIIYDYDAEAVILVKDTDYTLAWTNNTKPGAWNAMNGTKSIAPTVTITFKGRFSGKTSRTYTINPGELGNFTATDLIAQPNKTGLYSTTKLTLTDAQGNVLKSGTDYYALKDKVHPIEFTFKSFEYGTKGGEGAKGSVLIKENNAWIDREVKVGDPVLPLYCIKAGTEIKVTVYGKGNYEGKKAEAAYLFVDRDLSKAIVTIPNMTYRGTAYSADEIGQAMTVTMTKGGEPLVYGRDFSIAYLQNKADAGTVNVTITGDRIKGSVGEKKTTFKIVARTMDYSITYESNFDKIAEALYNKDAEDGTADHDLQWYKGNYRVTGTMKDSVTTFGGKLTKNSYVLQKKTVVNGKDTWKTVPASEVKFTGWSHTNTDSEAKYADQGAFTPSLIERLRFGIHYTLYGIWQIQ